MSNGIRDLPQSLISSVRETLATNQDLKHEDLKRRYPFAFPKKEEVKKIDEETLTQEDNNNIVNVIVERKVRKGKNNCWKIDSWDCEEDYNARKAPQVDFAYSQKHYNTLMDDLKKKGRFWEGTLITLNGEVVNEKITIRPDNSEDFDKLNELDTSSVRKAGGEITKIDSKIGAMVSKGNLPSKKDLKKLSNDARDDVYMVLAKYLGPDAIASKYGVDLDEGYMEVQLTAEILENESWGDILEINKDTPGVVKREPTKKSYASGYDNDLKLILRGPPRNTPQEAKQDAAKMKKGGYESVTVHVNGEMKEEKEMTEKKTIDMSKAVYKARHKSDKRMQYFVVMPRDIKGKSQDKFSMYVVKGSGEVVHDVGNKSSLDDAKKFAKNHGYIKEEKDDDMKDDNKDKDDKKGLDKVDKKQLKGDFKDREDKDIDNDGDSDDSDEYLHKRRKAVSKKIADKNKEKKED